MGEKKRTASLWDKHPVCMSKDCSNMQNVLLVVERAHNQKKVLLALLYNKALGMKYYNTTYLCG